jgi:hypothetical protein
MWSEHLFFLFTQFPIALIGDSNLVLIMKNKSYLLGAVFFLAVAASFAFAFGTNNANTQCCSTSASEETCCGIPCTDPAQCSIPCCKAEAPKAEAQQ